ncbi:Response regulator receiver [Alcaligenes faecalis subsp. faecalis NCIB 8687]|nr:Response regulator receiver [Alcaligenes faecalis subsp. faecalis NCIB 8687]
MRILDQFFISADPMAPLLVGSYNSGLVILSLLVAIFSSGMALHTAHIARMADLRLHRQIAICTGAIALGGGIWTMHFIGMLAFELCTSVHYDPAITMLSVLPSVGASWVALQILSQARVQRSHLIIGGVLVGLGIGTMHYTGMAAARFIGQTTPPDDLIIFNSTFASMVLSTFTITVTVLVAAANGLLRYRQLFLKMEESESHNRAIVDTAIDGIITISSNGTILDFNHSAERLFGWKAGEVLGRNVNMLMPEPDRSRHDSYLSNYLRSNDPKVIGVGRDVTGLRKDGSLMPMRLAVGRVRQPGDPIFVGFVTDMSRYNALTESLRQSAEKAEQAAQAKSAFLANMSHEIRTPLNAIIGFSDLMLNDALTAQQSKHLNIINQSARSLLALLNDILDTTKLERGSVELEQVDFSLIDLCQQVVASLRLAADAKNLEFRLSCAPELHPFYKGDPMRIQQVLNNLIGNAIKFTQSGAVRVEVNPEPGRNAVSIRVTDTGIGMSPEQLRHVFTPFTQADVSISRRFGGTGLGVSIARQLVDLMGGTLEVQSTLGVGSVFEVRIPLEPGNEPCLSPENQAVPHLPPLRILVADDINLNQELLTLTLEQHGHSVTATDSGHKVLELLDKEDFDVVLLDVHMPELDGLETARRWREQERREARLPLPLIALTASVMESDRHAAQEAGINGFATKPLDLPALMQEIARVMGLATTSSPDDSVEPQKSGLIDWDLGLSLWGSPVRLRRALLSFLSDLHTRYPLDEIKQASPNWEVVLGSLHGIRGTAGNLGLPQVSLLSAELEEKIRRGQTRQMRGRIEQLQDMFNRIAQELSHHGPPAPYTDSQAGVVHSPDVVLNYLHILHSSVQLNELDEPALQAICQYLESTGQSETLNNLNKTIDLFDFVQASSILTALITELNASLAKDPPRHE